LEQAEAARQLIAASSIRVSRAPRLQTSNAC
jgi:hypothetical protein